ncbi:ATP-binding protein [Ectopseudomonas guguanensis]|uniref:ATP-binding protein n=1 Tax=Ectopseudomonas guguanensis TaxID=1198456 RepID=UPI0028610D9F|nr:ATP-binding protein [Pseudomonas guguanensis]MDR8016154.1 ATP-binding protein [Pseudomonas guguanensis]
MISLISPQGALLMNRDQMDAHAVFRKDFTVITNAIAKASSTALEAIFVRQTGLIFHGLSRVGKTSCIKTINSQLRGFMPRAYVIQIEVVKKEGSFTNNILDQLATEEGVKFRSRETPVGKLDRISEHVINRCAEKFCNHWVLLLDEFQRLRPHDLHVLFDLFNRLDRKGITMTILSFAMPAVFKQREDLMYAGNSEQLIARFMSELIEFKGCTSAQDLAVILQTFDEKSEYPPKSGITYTNGFAPQAFATGFRLEPLHGSFWKALNSASAGGYKNNVPLEHLFLSIRYLLRYLSQNDYSRIVIPDKLLDEVVQKSNLPQFCMLNGGGQG